MWKTTGKHTKQKRFFKFSKKLLKNFSKSMQNSLDVENFSELFSKSNAFFKSFSENRI